MIIPVEALRIAYNALKYDIEHLESLMQTQSDNMQDIIRSIINRKKKALSEIKEFCPDVECDFFKIEKAVNIYKDDEIKMHENSEPQEYQEKPIEIPGFRNDLQKHEPVKRNEATPQEIADIIEQLENSPCDPNMTFSTIHECPLDNVRHCPTCAHWWFDRIHHGCRIDDKRATNTTAMLGSSTACGPCDDYQPNTE